MIENARKMTAKELKEIIFKNYYKQTGFTKEDSYSSIIYYYIKKKATELNKVKEEHYELFLRRKA